MKRMPCQYACSCPARTHAHVYTPSCGKFWFLGSMAPNPFACNGLHGTKTWFRRGSRAGSRGGSGRLSGREPPAALPSRLAGTLSACLPGCLPDFLPWLPVMKAMNRPLAGAGNPPVSRRQPTALNPALASPAGAFCFAQAAAPAGQMEPTGTKPC